MNSPRGEVLVKCECLFDRKLCSFFGKFIYLTGSHYITEFAIFLIIFTCGCALICKSVSELYTLQIV